MKTNNNILFLDKPYNWSSNYLLNKIKLFIKKEKYGYIGTLDPLATGMLPIVFDSGTKKFQFLLYLKKIYIVIAKFGNISSTYDSEGTIIKYNYIKFNVDIIKKSIYNFIGKYYQTPPLYSSIKINGIESYKYARNNISINIKPRLINIYDIKIISYYNEFFKFKVICSKGTYIRSLIHDIGLYSEYGAYVYYLRRISIGKYKKMVLLNNIIYKNKYYI